MWLTLMITLWCPEASAYEVMTNDYGDDLVWQELPAPYASNVSSTPESVSRTGFAEAVDQAFTAWGTVPGSALAFARQDSTETVKSYYDDGINAVYWTEDWQWDPEVLALTSTWATSSGEVIGFDMRINARDHDWATDGDPERADLLNMLTHEAGHAVGLDHSADETATMYGVTSLGEVTKRDLSADDEDAVRDLYLPQDISNAAALLGCQSIGVHPASVLALLAALFPLLRLRRR